MSKHENYDKLFENRCAYAFFLFICLCLFSVLRVSVISSGEEYALAQENQGSYRITVKRNRGTVYDTNMVALTNNKTEEYVAIPPTADAIMDVPSFLYGEEKERVLKELENNNIAIAVPNGKVSSKSVAKTKIYKTDENDFSAPHIIGYINGEGHGVCGIEKAYDSFLYRENTVDVLYEADGKGNLLYGEKPRFENNLSDVFDGVRLTIDINIQKSAEESTADLEKGAFVVCEADSGKIRAILSKPDFSPFEIEKYLDKQDSPLLNRAVTPFSVGSVFKPCVAIAGIESGNAGFLFNCEGKTHIIDRDFSCHEKRGHGWVDLKDAIAYSCNTFFYNYGIKVGANRILRTASVLNFGSSFKIGDDFYVDGGNLTKPENLSNDALIANFSIGQGDLMLSPVSMLTLYMSIANEGSYILPSIVESTVSGGKQSYYKTAGKTKVMEKTTAHYLKNALKKVVKEGTGTMANIDGIEIAGKTATAQTGRFDSNGKEITNSWFCGFFPAENPKYVAVIMSDGENKVTLSEIFGKFVQNLSKNT